MEAPTTSASLLLRLRDARDIVAWNQFTEIYAPLVYRYARRRGLQDADAADVAQETLRAVHGAIDRFEYDPARGAFRGWLLTLAHHKLYDYQVKRNSREQASGDSQVQRLLKEAPAPDATAHAEWQHEHRQQIFRVAAEQVREQFSPATWQAFWSTAVEGTPAPEVASKLQVSVGAVYIAKSRVLRKIKERVQALDD